MDDAKRWVGPWRRLSWWRTLAPSLGPLRSLTVKNLAIFLTIFVVALAPMAYFYRQDVKEHRVGVLATRLELIAEQSVRRIDPALVTALTDASSTGSPAHARLVGILAGIQREFAVDNAVLLRRTPEGRFEYLADGSRQFEVAQPVSLHDRFPGTFRAAARAWERQGRVHTELFGFGVYEYLQLNRPIEQDGRVVALLMVNRFAEEVDQAIRRDTIKLVALTLAVFLAGSLVFGFVSRRLLRPLVQLKQAANRVAAGDLAVQILPVRGGDEVARLNESFRAMVQQVRQSREALEHNNAELKRTLARVQMMEDLETSLFKLVPRTVRSALNADPHALERGKTARDVSVLFLDLEGSSVLTEALEPSRMDRLIEACFSDFLDVIHEHQGDITETAGDGLMIIFQGDDPAQHALNAVRTALAVQAIIGDRATNGPSGELDLRINIGVNSGEALVGFTRFEAISGTRVTFTASGRTTIVAARLQALAQRGSVLLSAETWQRVASLTGNRKVQAEVEDLGAIHLKNLHEPERVWRLLPPARSRAAPAVVAAG